MDFKDYYSLLGVKPETSAEEMKRAYRKLARQYHPDVSKLPDAEKKFKEINEAWEVLKDPEKRAQYDQLRTGGWKPPPERKHYQDFSGEHDFGNDNDFSDFFNAIFGAQAARQGHRGFQAKGKDYHAKIQIPLSMAYHGGVQTLTLQMPQNVKNLNVKIPAGVGSGSQIRLKGQGGEGVGGAPAGDLYVEIEIQPHPHFSVHHKDIHLTLPIAPWEAALGATIAVPTLGGNVNVKIHPGAQSGQKLRLKGRGLPNKPAGDQYVILQIQAPHADTEKAKALYQEMANSMPFDPRKGLGV